MSVERHSGYFTVVCSHCGARTPGEFTFNDAVRAKKQHGWRSVKAEGEWQDLCPDCLAEEKGEKKAATPEPPEVMTFAKLPDYCAGRRYCDDGDPCKHKTLCSRYYKTYGIVPSAAARIHAGKERKEDRAL